MSESFLPAACVGLVGALFAIIAARITHSLVLHPLRRFAGPWYAACSSLPLSLTSVMGKEQEWLSGLVQRYSSQSPNTTIQEDGTGRNSLSHVENGQPVRIAPSLLLFPKASALREIYWDPKCNDKSAMYGHEPLVPTSIFTTIDGQKHKILRKALGGPKWSVGVFKKNWEARVDELTRTWKTNQLREDTRPIELGNKFTYVIIVQVAIFDSRLAY
jgi:hypothetical protein